MAQSYQVDIVTKVTNISSVAKLDKAIKQLAVNEDKVAAAANKAAGSQEKFGRAASRAGNSAKSASGGVKSLGTAFALATAKITAIVAAVQTFSSAMNAAFTRQQAEQRLKNLTGSTEEYQASLQAAASIAQKFSLTQTEATQALGDVYSRLSGVGFGLKEVTTIYEGFNVVARESGITSEAASSAFLQLGQAMGSGVLQGDELRSILEQMPQLTQMIAQEMGIAASQVKKFGSEGKITSEVIFAALQKAQNGAEGLNEKLTPADQAFRQFKVAADQLAVAFGTSLLPLITQLATGFTNLLLEAQKLVEKFTQLNTEVAASVNPLREFTEGVELSQEVVEGLRYSLDGLLEAALGLIPGFTQLTRLFEYMGKLKGIFTGTSDEINKVKEATTGVDAEAGKTLDKFSSMPDKVKATADAKKEVQAAQKEINALISQQSEAESLAVSQIDQKLAIANAVLDKEMAINDAKKQAAEADLAAAQTAEERLDAINRIYEASVTNAKLQYEQTMAAVEAEVAKKEAAVGTQLVLQAQVQTTVELQRAAGIFNAHQEIALANAMKGVQIAQQQLDVQLQIAQEVEQTARARYEMQVAAADTLRQQQMQEQQQHATNAAIGQGVQQMNALAAAASNAADQVARATGGGGGGGGRGGVMTRNADGSRTYRGVIPMEMITGPTSRGGYGFRQDLESGANKIKHSRFGEITYDQYKYLQENPTHGLKHYRAAKEAEREEQKKIQYEIQHGPDSYEQSFSKTSSRYRAMQRENPNVNVNYSGTTLSFNGADYVKKGDVKGIVNSAVGSTLKTMRTSSSARLSSGLR